MEFTCQSSLLSGTLQIPGSKSHSIRAIFIATMAKGESMIHNLLDSSDVRSALSVARIFGAKTESLGNNNWKITGVNGNITLTHPVIDVGNSGTTIQIALAFASLIKNNQSLIVTGDEQICRRPTAPLVQALRDLGTEITEIHHNGCPPIKITGGLTGGKCELEAKTSQYVTALLMACPLAENDSEVTVTLLNEAPYIEITLDWLKEQNITIHHDDLYNYQIPGHQHYTCFDKAIPADFSTATFFLAAATLKPDRQITLKGLDFTDSQPDKQVVYILEKMGAKIEHLPNGDITISAPNGLTGITIDMNETPDALPMLAVVGCFARGETRLINVAHARLKETDRIQVMAEELTKMGANITELPDGLIIRQSSLTGTKVCGHGDHRIVMSLAIAGLSCEGTTTITTAEAAAVTVPEFSDFIKKLGGNLSTLDPISTSTNP